MARAARQDASATAGMNGSTVVEVDLSPGQQSAVSGRSDQRNAGYMQALRRGKRPMPTLNEVSLRQVMNQENILQRRF